MTKPDPPAGRAAPPASARSDSAFRSCLAVVALWASLVGSAFAHGDPPGARALLQRQPDAPTVVLLDEGLALSADHGFDYICPHSEDAEGAVAATAGSTVLTSDGRAEVRVLQTDGTLKPHPTWEPSGTVLQLSTGSRYAYGLVRTTDETLLFQLDPTSHALLYRSSLPLTAMAVTPKRIVLAGSDRLIGHWVELDTDAPQEAEPNHRVLDLFPNTIAVFPRLVSGRDYLVMLYSQFQGSELVEVGAEGLNPIQSATTLMSGPVSFQDELYVAYDGHLGLLRNGQVELLETPIAVTCVGANADAGYACTTQGLAQLHPTGLGQELFRLADLSGPASGPCAAAWQLYRLDLKQAGITVRAQPHPNAGSVNASGDSAGEDQADAGSEDDMARPADAADEADPDLHAKGTAESEADSEPMAGSVVESSAMDASQDAADASAPDAPTEADLERTTHGCGCRLSPSPQQHGGWCTLGLAFLALGRRLVRRAA